MYILHLSQLIHNPTHIMGNILDLVLTNDCTLISDVKVDCDRKLFLATLMGFVTSFLIVTLTSVTLQLT